MNWQWFVFWFSGTDFSIQRKPLGDFECIQIGIHASEACKNSKAQKKMELDAIGLKVNLYSMTVTNLQN